MMPKHCCSACDGLGGQVVVDSDEYSEFREFFACEACQRSGYTTSCRECSEVMPLPEAEQNSYRCPRCIAEGEYAGREMEIERLRGWG